MIGGFGWLLMLCCRVGGAIPSSHVPIEIASLRAMTTKKGWHCEARSEAAISSKQFVDGGGKMIGWRARLGFLVPPGNPTVESEMIALAPAGVSVHFHRMTARGAPGAPDGQDARNRMMLEHIDESVEMLALVKPDIIVIAHTATSYHLGREAEANLLKRL